MVKRLGTNDVTVAVVLWVIDCVCDKILTSEKQKNNR